MEEAYIVRQYKAVAGMETVVVEDSSLHKEKEGEVRSHPFRRSASSRDERRKTSLWEKIVERGVTSG